MEISQNASNERSNSKTRLSNVGGIINKRKDTHIEVVTDLFESGFLKFLPHSDKNQDGDKRGFKKEFARDVGMLAKSLNQDENKFKEYKKTYSEVYGSDNLHKDRIDVLNDKAEACDNLLLLKRDPGKAYDESQLVGKYIKSVAGSSNMVDSSFISDYVGDIFKGSFKAVYAASKEIGGIAKSKPNDKFSESEAVKLITAVKGAIEKQKDSYREKKYNSIPKEQCLVR